MFFICWNNSSLITAICQNNSAKKIETFSIGFGNGDYDESMRTKKVASILNTNHNECIIDTNKYFSVFDKVIDIYDEPFADSSDTPSILLSQFARKKLKLLLLEMVRTNCLVAIIDIFILTR